MDGNTSHEADRYQFIELEGITFKEVNTIAILGANRSLNSSDFSLSPYLVDAEEAEVMNPDSERK